MERLSLQPLNPSTGIPYYRQIVNQITELVGSGQLQAGQPLPSVRELAADLLVSLITIRKAYSDLEAAGIVNRRQGKGTYVSLDVEQSTRKWSRTEGLTLLENAVGKAKRLGLTEDEILQHVTQLVGGCNGSTGTA